MCRGFGSGRRQTSGAGRNCSQAKTSPKRGTSHACLCQDLLIFWRGCTPEGQFGGLFEISTWLWWSKIVGDPKMGCPGKWKHGFQHLRSNSWWFNFDPNPHPHVPPPLRFAYSGWLKDVREQVSYQDTSRRSDRKSFGQENPAAAAC